MTSPSFEPILAGYGFARVKDQAFQAIRRLWRQRQQEGWSQNDLADRLERDPAWVSRKLSGPSNWTLRTFGDLADAMDGEVEITVHDLNAGPSTLRNFDAYLSWTNDDPIDYAAYEDTVRIAKTSNSASNVELLEWTEA